MNLTKLDDEPQTLNEDDEEHGTLKLYEVVAATAIVTFALGGLAVVFASLAMSEYVNHILKRFRRKGGQHVQ